MENVPPELHGWMKVWPGLSLLLPKLKQSLNSFYHEGRRYYGLLKTVRELERFTSHATTTSVIWRQYIVCGRDSLTFVRNFIEPMCFLMTQAESVLFCLQFQSFFDRCIKQDIDKRWFSNAPVQEPVVSKEIHDLFDFEPIQDINTKSSLPSIDLCDKDGLRALFESDNVESKQQQHCPNTLPSLSIADEDSLESWPDIATKSQEDTTFCSELSPLDW